MKSVDEIVPNHIISTKFYVEKLDFCLIFPGLILAECSAGWPKLSAAEIRPIWPKISAEYSVSVVHYWKHKKYNFLVLNGDVS